jgi:hypothetical protein
MLTAPIAHAFPFCTLQPIIHTVSALSAAKGTSLIYQNTKEDEHGTYVMTDHTKALTGYAITAAAATFSALTIIYCNNAR